MILTMYPLTPLVIPLVVVAYAIYRRLSRISISKVSGPPANSWLYGENVPYFVRVWISL